MKQIHRAELIVEFTSYNNANFSLHLCSAGDLPEVAVRFSYRDLLWLKSIFRADSYCADVYLLSADSMCVFTIDSFIHKWDK